MKLTARQIESFLTNPLQVRGILLYGPDHGGISDRLEVIARNVLSGNDPAFSRTDLSEETCLHDPALLLDGLQAMSLLGGVQLVCLKQAGDKSASIIKEALAQTQNTNFLLVSADELSPRSPLRQYFEKATDLAALPCYREEGASLANLIQQTLSKHHLNADRDVIRYLATSLTGDRHLILAELNRIALYFASDGHITLDKLKEITGTDIEMTLDEVARAFASRDARLFCHSIDTLINMGTQPVVFIRTIDRLLGRILDILVIYHRGNSLEHAVSSVKPPVFFKDKPLFIQYASQWETEQLRRVRHQLMRLEIKTKLYHETAELRLKNALLYLMGRKTLKSTAAQSTNQFVELR